MTAPESDASELRIHHTRPIPPRFSCESSDAHARQTPPIIMREGGGSDFRKPPNTQGPSKGWCRACIELSSQLYELYCLFKSRSKFPHIHPHTLAGRALKNRELRASLPRLDRASTRVRYATVIPNESRATDYCAEMGLIGGSQEKDCFPGDDPRGGI